MSSESAQSVLDVTPNYTVILPPVKIKYAARTKRPHWQTVLTSLRASVGLAGPRRLHGQELQMPLPPSEAPLQSQPETGGARWRERQAQRPTPAQTAAAEEQQEERAAAATALAEADQRLLPALWRMRQGACLYIHLDFLKILLYYTIKNCAKGKIFRYHYAGQTRSAYMTQY